jgi:hypothetical protein
MTAVQEYKTKHKEIKGRLTSMSFRKTKGIGVIDICNAIGKKLGFSGQTIYNYLQGRIKDGYLAEAICKEFDDYITSISN